MKLHRFHNLIIDPRSVISIVFLSDRADISTGRHTGVCVDLRSAELLATHLGLPADDAPPHSEIPSPPASA